MNLKILFLWKKYCFRKKRENAILCLNKFLNKKIINEYQNKFIRKYNNINSCEKLITPKNNNEKIIEINELNYENILRNEYRVEGNFMMLDFIVYDDNNTQIGSIKRKFISIGDKYEISINDISKKEIVLAIIVAITNDVNRNQNSSSSSD